MFRKRRISQISTIGQLLRTRQLWGVLGRQRWSRKFGRGIGDRKTFCWRTVDWCSKKSSLDRLATPTRLGRKKSSQGRLATPTRLGPKKVQSGPTGNANRQPPYWWCLVCRTASRGASSLGCLRKSRWSKFVVEMWIFKIDLKFRFEFFVVVCNHAHTIFRTQVGPK